MRELGAIGYSVAAFGFSILTILFITSWRGRTHGAILVAAAFLTTVWAAFAAYKTIQNVIVNIPLIAVELLHNCVWIAFILFVLNQRGIDKSLRRNFTIFLSLLAAIVALNIIFTAFSESATRILYFKSGFELTVLSQLLVAICGLVLVEQLFRNVTTGERWSLKYLCFGVGGIFAYDCYLYSDALLYKQIDEVVWVARGYINAIVVPLIAVSAARNPQWSLDVFVSRKVVFHTATVTAISIYLIIIALGGYYIRKFGGSWGGVAQLLILFASLLLLAALFFSGQVRGKLRVLVNKHFFNYRYDYRDEWLRFIDTLSDEKLEPQLRVRVISAVADVVDSPGGMLWLRNDDKYQLAAVWNVKLATDQSIYDQDIQTLVEYMQYEKHVVDVDEGFINNASGFYHLPEWIDSIEESWLFVPLLRHDELYGFIFLTRARAQLEINWENLDLLITTGRQVTNHLALLAANEKLMEARQFEAFNRLSAYLVHDLKNISAQLGLVVKNSEKHKDNPDFIDDVIMTVSNAVAKMDRMLSQLRTKSASVESLGKVHLLKVVEKVLHNRYGQNPKPTLCEHDESLYVLADADRLTSVLEHLVQNAQDATPDTGSVKVSFFRRNRKVELEIEDNGVGMEPDFIRSRLFRPFDTTKGNAGMGVGMYESRETIKSFGGNIEVKSEMNSGTTIKISLDLCEAENSTGLENLATE